MSKKKISKHNQNRLYARRITETIDKALDHYPRLLALRIDLRFPDEEDRLDCPTRYYAGSDVISLFINSVKSQIEEDIKRKIKAGKTTLTCYVRFVWVREFNQEGSKKHYHVLLLLNKDAYAWPGLRQTDTFYDRYTLFQMVINAWLRAINRADKENKYHGLVHMPQKGYYQLNRKKPDFKATYEELTERAMYLAKERSKDSSDGQRSFGCSQY
ncbi:inovirus Gp2 family protein [Serratia sp. J2]|uniref:inovirus Gp2 family protein n=1 Tax=Serratia sp. J2 TaxID=3386551 RepID=UPI003916D5BE